MREGEGKGGEGMKMVGLKVFVCFFVKRKRREREIEKRGIMRAR